MAAASHGIASLTAVTSPVTFLRVHYGIIITRATATLQLSDPARALSGTIHAGLPSVLSPNIQHVLPAAPGDGVRTQAVAYVDPRVKEVLRKCVHRGFHSRDYPLSHR